MSAALPPVPVITGEYRALSAYEAAPHDCGAVAVPDDRFAPHLRAGELAVIDPDDNEPVNGELYVVKISSQLAEGGYRLAFVQLRSRDMQFGHRDTDGHWRPDEHLSRGWWLHFRLIHPRPQAMPTGFSTIEEAVANVSSFSLCEGPLTDEGMRRWIVGRVIGVVHQWCVLLWSLLSWRPPSFW